MARAFEPARFLHPADRGADDNSSVGGIFLDLPVGGVAIDALGCRQASLVPTHGGSGTRTHRNIRPRVSLEVG